MGRVAHLVLCAIVSGIVIQSVISTPLVINVILCCVMLLLGLWHKWFFYFTIMFLAAISFSLHTCTQTTEMHREAVFSGTVVSEAPYARSVRLLIDLDHVHVGSKIMPFDKTVTFHTRMQKTMLGQHLLIRGKLKSDHRADHSAALVGTILANSSPTSLTGRIQYSVNQFIEEVFSSTLQHEQKDIATSLILGGSGRVETELRDAFSRAGVLHILAVSGLHVGFVAVFVGFLLLVVPVSLRVKFVLTMLVLLLYAAVTGFRSSVCRATVMAFLFGSATLIQKNVKPLHIVNITAIAFLIVNPLVVFNLSMQLSFAAVYGIIILFPQLNERVVRRVSNRFVRRILTIMAVSLSAQAFVSPLLIHYFHRLPTCAIISNCIIVPLASVTVFALFCCLGVGVVSFTCAQSVAHVASLCIYAIVGVSGFFADLPFAVVTLYLSPLVLIPLYLLFFRRTMKIALFSISAILVLFSLSSLPECLCIVKNQHTSIITLQNTTCVVTRERASRVLQTFLSQQQVRRVDCLIAPEGCLVSAVQFCALPDALHIKKIGMGLLCVNAGDNIRIQYGTLQLLLHDCDTVGMHDEQRITYIITDGSHVYQFHAPCTRSIIDQMFVDSKMLFGKFLFLF